MLSTRQVELLKAIIEEYLSSSEPVGSTTLVQKYSLKCSAATVRNEMARMLEQGFLEMEHTSSGRVPTPLAYKFFLAELMEEDDMPVLQEVAIKQRLWPTRFEFYKLLRQAAVSLADVTKELALLTSDDGFVTHAGAVNVLDSREFWDIDVAKTVLNLSDHPELLEDLFSKAPADSPMGDVCYMIGDDLGNKNLSQCSVVFAPFRLGNKSGHVSVLGPARMHYASVIPAVRYTKGLLEEFGGGW